MSILISSACQLNFRQLVKKYNIQRIHAELGFGVVKTTQITDLQINCLNDALDPMSQYKVSFKLQGSDSDIGRYLSSVSAVNGLEVNFFQQASTLTSDQIESQLKNFINNIAERLAEAKKEQKIQSIVFVGNRFTINNQSTFKVLSDDGEGKLAIELEGDSSIHEGLKLSSHGLMDGLYMGSIKLANG